MAEVAALDGGSSEMAGAEAEPDVDATLVFSETLFMS